MLIIDDKGRARAQPVTSALGGRRLESVTFNEIDMAELVKLDDQQLLDWFRTTVMTCFGPVASDDRMRVHAYEAWHRDLFNRGMDLIKREDL